MNSVSSTIGLQTNVQALINPQRVPLQIERPVVVTEKANAIPGDTATPGTNPGQTQTARPVLAAVSTNEANPGMRYGQFLDALRALRRDLYDFPPEDARDSREEIARLMNKETVLDPSPLIDDGLPAEIEQPAKQAEKQDAPVQSVDPDRAQGAERADRDVAGVAETRDAAAPRESTRAEALSLHDPLDDPDPHSVRLSDRDTAAAKPDYDASDKTAAADVKAASRQEPDADARRPEPDRHDRTTD